MNLPFTTEQFLTVFEQYNQTVWPFQILLNLVALCALILAVRRTTQSDKIISAILAFLWLWIGIVYHLIFFAPINPAARIFAGLNILQGLMFIYFGLFRPRLSFQFNPNFYGITGSILILYGLIIYPVLGIFLGHQYPKSPTFGLPCPTTIFTLGLFLWTSAKMPKTILIIPFIWSVIGFSAALTMGIYEDIGLLVAGIAATTMAIIRDRKSPDAKAGAARVA